MKQITRALALLVAVTMMSAGVAATSFGDDDHDGDRDGRRQGNGAVGGAVVVVGDEVADGDRSRVVEDRRWGYQAVLQAGGGGDELAFRGQVVDAVLNVQGIVNRAISKAAAPGQPVLQGFTACAQLR